MLAVHNHLWNLKKQLKPHGASLTRSLLPLLNFIKRLVGWSLPIRRGDVSNSPSASFGTWVHFSIASITGTSTCSKCKITRLCIASTRHCAEPNSIDGSLDGLRGEGVEVEPVQRAFLWHWLVVLTGSCRQQVAFFILYPKP